MRAAAIALVAVLAGCQAPAGVTATVRVRMADAYALQASVSPWRTADVARLDLTLARLDDGAPTTLATRTVTDPQAGGLARTYAFGPLQRFTTYRVTATAYDPADAVISTADAGSYVEFYVDADDAPAVPDLKVHLRDRGTSSRFVAPPAPLAAGDVAAPSVAFGAGSQLVAWAEGGAVRARLLDGEGAPFTLGAGARPRVAFGGGTFLVAWEDGGDVRARRVSAAGVPEAGTLDLCVDAAAQDEVALSYGARADAFLVAWRDARGGGPGLRGLTVPAAGGAPSAEASLASGDTRTPAIAYFHDAATPALSRWLVAWAETGGGIRGQRVGPDGAPVSGAIALSTDATGAQAEPAVAYNTDRREFLVAWRDAAAIRARRFSRLAVPLQPDDLVAASGALPAVGYNPAAREYLVAWRQSAGPGDDRLMAQRRSVEPEFRSSIFRVDDAALPPRALGAPALAFNDLPAANEFLLVWPDLLELTGRRLESYLL